MTRRGPLAGIVVLDLTHALSGPYCTMLLAEMGARVIKVEQPPGGDMGRLYPPLVDGEPEFFNAVNHGKESLLADLADPADRPLLYAIADRADVLVENFRPGVLDGWGLGFDELRRRNPALVYASITGFGQTGPEAWEGAYDVVIQAESGLMSVTGFPDGPPVLTGTSIADYLSGMNAFGAISAALVQSRTSGVGSRVDIAMFDSLLAILGAHVFGYLAAGVEPQRAGNTNPLATPFDIYEAADGAVAVCAPTDSGFATLSAWLGRPELVRDPRFVDPAARVAHRDELTREIEAALAGLTRDEAVEQLQRAGIPAGRVRTVPEAIESAQAHERRMVLEVEGSRLRYPGHALHLDTVDDDARRPRAAGLGEHTEALRSEFLGGT
ncbi:MAG: CoA transferase [Acidimicrobiales bacterium]|jgi:CoA:oxalate CoA-transferase|nr:CoA transferase [Acidimicrobiales bacterium]